MWFLIAIAIGYGLRHYQNWLYEKTKALVGPWVQKTF